MSIASLYPSINPSLLLDFANSKVLDSRVTFTRTTTATYYDGVTTAKAEENLLTYSQEFDNAAWTKTNVTVTANSVAAPDGTTTADTITGSSGTAWKAISQATANSAFNSTSATFSFFAKEGTHRYIQLSINGDATKYVNFDLNGSGATSAFGTGVTSSVTAVANGFIRCVVSLTTAATTSNPYISLQDSLSAAREASTTSTNYFYLWGFQAELRSSATAYTATTTQAIANYIPVLQTAAAGQARFDHNPTTGESLGLLIEEARTNACPYSEAIGSWSAVNATAQSNVTIAPSGALTADKILPDATASVAHGWYNTITAAASTTYTISIFAKAAEYSWLYLTEGNNVTATAFFNLSTGALGTVSGTGSPSATITSVGNGWYRCSLTFTTAVGATAANIQARVTTADNTTSFTASSGTVGYSGIFVWGGQFETGSFATSYIPNLSTGSTTRNADAASMTGTNFSSWFNNGEGTVYSESTPTAQTSNGHVLFSLLSTAGQNFIASGQYIANSMVRSIIIDVNAVNQVLLVGSNGANNKIAAAYKANDFAGSINGSAASTDTSGTVPVVAQAYLGSLGTFGQPYTGTIKKLAYYPIRVTNAQLQSLTV